MPFWTLGYPTTNPDSLELQSPLKVNMTIKSRVEKLEERTIPDQQVLFIQCRPRDGETLHQARDRWLADHGMTRDDLQRFRHVYTFGF